jgi:methylthioribose-1-phosphate isomerase
VLSFSSVDWSPDRRALRYLDQRALPAREEVHEVHALDDVIDAIRTLAIRGAPAIGVGAAIGLVAALERAGEGDPVRARSLLPEYAARLEASRPTAVNLAWAVRRMVARAARETDADLLPALREEAECIRREDIAMCESIGEHGLTLVPDGTRVLTHCNAGALATAGTGTALAPVYAAHARGRSVTVHVGETRPLRQGARLTAWELQRAGIDVTVIPDSAAASLLRSGQVDVVIVGADRIAANGDVANKIGTYALALAAAANGVPFYVAAPQSTIDPATPDGNAIVIEHRDRGEMGELPAGVHAWNPAFDVTPRELVTGYITDRGFVEPPFVSV